MPINQTHTIVISDLHLGSSVSQPEKALALLKSYSFRKLILLGDIFDSLDFRDLSQECWDLLTYIGKISQDKKVRWVIGNHDEGLYNIFRTLLNAKIYHAYFWTYQNNKYIAIHGHQFDRFLVDNKLISRLATIIYNFIQRLDTENKKFSHYLKRTSKGWLRSSEKVAHSALGYCRENKANYIFCGHTHKAEMKSQGNLKYFNSGCWTDTPCSFITIDDNDIKILNY